MARNQRGGDHRIAVAILVFAQRDDPVVAEMAARGGAAVRPFGKQARQSGIVRFCGRCPGNGLAHVDQTAETVTRCGNRLRFKFLGCDRFDQFLQIFRQASALISLRSSTSCNSSTSSCKKSAGAGP